MWKRVSIMHQRWKRRMYVAKNHDNKKKLMIKFFIYDYFARSTWTKNNKKILRKIKKNWNLMNNKELNIHYIYVIFIVYIF
jgi:hypothetical protein